MGAGIGEVVAQAERLVGAMVVDDQEEADRLLKWLLQRGLQALFAATQVWGLTLLGLHGAGKGILQIKFINDDLQLVDTNLDYIRLAVDFLQAQHQNRLEDALVMFEAADESTRIFCSLWICEQAALRFRDMAVNPN